MPKPRSVSLKKALLPSDIFSAFFFFKPLFFIAVFLLIQSKQAVAQTYKGFENRILMDLCAHRTTETSEFMHFISDNTQYINLGIPVVLLLNGLISKEKEMVQKGFYIIKSLAVTSVITYAAKYTFNRKRPYEVNPFITKAGKGGSPSFPSGHTSEVFSTATSISLSYPKWYVIVPAYAWAGTVGFSRMYLGVHYPSDVLAGALVGSGSAWLMYTLNKKMHRRKIDRTYKYRYSRSFRNNTDRY